MDKNNELKWFSWESVSLSESHRLESISLLLNSDTQLMKFIFDFSRPKLRLPADDLIKKSMGMSRGEQVLVTAAIDIWCESGAFNFSLALRHWDDTNMSRFIRAISHLREIRNEVMHGLIDDQDGGFCL